MFANFSNTSQGLIKTDPRPKSDESKLTCLPCRRKKKKCDFTKPTCGRCRNSYGQDTCVWSNGQRKQRSRSRDIQSQEHDIQTRPSSSSSTSSRNSMTLVRRHVSLTPSTSPMDLGFENFCPWSMPNVVSNISPYEIQSFLVSRFRLTSLSDLSPQVFLNISMAFQNRVLCLDIDFKDSIIAQSLPLALEHPTLLHAWIACSVIALSQSMPYWHEKAIKHYDSAVSGLSQALQESQQTSDEWKRATVILLHLFEGFQSKDEESALGKAHLSGARELFIYTVQDRSPMSYHDALVLEAYIVHTTHNYLFQPDSRLPITHMEEALETLKTAMGRLNMDCNWRNSPWIGFGGLDLADMIYRVSWLTHKPDLDNDDQEQVQNIIARLSSWTAPACREESLATDLDLPPRRLVTLAQAYWCACSFLATHLVQEETNTLPLDSSAFVAETLELLDQLVKYEHTINNHLWPLVVVGTAASTIEIQDHIRSLLPQFKQALGSESIKRAERFLATAWKIDNHGEMYGRRIFHDREALHRMFF
ncbi:hypothetical protein E4T39_00056 [Aureobasidium subglaciale]|nr:hypothetical protein E4T39_00056 [Aureobasidium subglaciale]